MLWIITTIAFALFSVLLLLLIILSGRLFAVGLMLKLGRIGLIKAYRDGSVEIATAKNPKQIEFKSKDRMTKEEIRSIVPVKQVWHWLRGYNKPVHVAIEGEASTTNLLDMKKTDEFTGEKIADLIMVYGNREFERGRKLGMSESRGLDKQLVIFLILIIFVTAISAYFGYQNYDALHKLAQSIAALSGKIGAAIITPH